MSGSNVDGHVLINNSGVVVVQNNDLWDGRLVIRRSDQVAVIDNNVEGRIVVNRNIVAVVSKNSSDANIVCLNNTDLSASFNRARRSDNCGD